MSITVAINVPIVPGSGGGGVEQHVLGIVRAHARSDADDIEYVLIIDDPDPTWIEPYVSDDMTLVTPPEPSWVDELKRNVGSVAKRVARPVLKRTNVHNRFRPEPTVPDADGRFAIHGADVVHFPTPPYYRTDLPSIFCPHDLQHRHYPDFFREWTRKRRRAIYPVGCREADVVVTPSEFVKSDVVDTYDVPSDRVTVIPRGAPTDLYESIDESTVAETLAEYDLPETFALYPAQTMEHKNHVRLVEAIGRLRDEGVRTDIVLTGNQSEYWSTIERTISEVGVSDRIHALGYIPGPHLRALYRLAKFVVFPSLFEGGGFPLTEAWSESIPIACSETTALGERAGDAALTFDPTSVSAIAEAIRRMHDDEQLRLDLVKRGNQRIRGHSWAGTGRAYRDLYRTLAARAPSSGDEEPVRTPEETLST